MPDVGAGCHELRIVDRDQTWRIVYHIAADAVVLLEVFSKKTSATPRAIIAGCQRRLQSFRALGSTKPAKKDR